MTTSELITYMSDCEKLNEQTLSELKSIVEEYPYFHTAHLLLAKNRYLTAPGEFKKHLHETATFCADRKRLFYLINSDKYTAFFQKPETSGDDDRTRTLLDSYLTNFADREEEVPHVASNIISSDYLTYVQNFEGDFTSEGESDGEDSEVPEEKNELKHQDIIDSFLEKAETNETLFSPTAALQESTRRTDTETDGGGFLTETLARIYIKQKKYEQALAIIRQLSLNFPKKSAYFADHIRFLELLIINEKNKKQ